MLPNTALIENSGTDPFLRLANYTNNALNQITSRDVPGKVDIVGVTTATATNVSVNSQAAYRRGEYYQKDLTVSNGSGPVLLSVTNSATQSGNTSNVIGNLLVPPTVQTLAYDADGNLTNDSVWVYVWDGENRLIQMTNLATVTSSARKKLVFTYDFVGQRASKKVFDWSGSDYAVSPSTDIKFIYDGLNLIAEIDSSSAILQSFLWGLDLSGTLNQAGGIGGLLVETDHGGGGATTNHFVPSDGNGNVVALVKVDGALSARYEYGSFGEVIRASGELAKSNPFRWSTKFTDEETGLTYYGQRFYHGNLGRWINRDPSPDQLLELYCFTHNGPTLAIDPDGRNPLIIAGVISGAAGAILGAITAKTGEKWIGAGKGALVGFVSPFVGFGAYAVAGESVLAGGFTAGLFSSATASALDNYQNAKRLFDFSPKQLGAIYAGAIVGAVSGAALAYLEHVGGMDISEAMLDGMLTIASTFGLGAAETWGAGAEKGYEEEKKLLEKRASDITILSK